MLRARELGPLAVSRLKADGLHAVGGIPGLYLQIAGAARSWILRATVGSKRRDIGLGSFPAVTLAQARERAREARDLIFKGIDPVLQRKRLQSDLVASQGQAKTFAEVQRLFLDAKSEGWRNAKHRAQWQTTLDTYAGPVLGRVLVSEVTQGHVESVLAPIWARKTETASRLRGRIAAVLDYATAKGWRSGDNPARWRGLLDKTLAAPAKLKAVQHHRALPIDDMPAFMVDLRQREGTAARALEFVILTAARSGEVRGATWDEFDLAARIWTVPAARMKAGKAHRVPLCDRAVELLKALPRIEGDEVVFAAPLGGRLSDMAMTEVLRRMEVDAVPHGFRSTFRDWCAERTQHPREVAELALAHTVGDAVERAYRRGDMFAKRAELMRDWQRFLDGALAPVVPLRKRA